jgi:hypothetical protein
MGTSHSLWIATKPEGLLAPLPGALLVFAVRQPAAATFGAIGHMLHLPGFGWAVLLPSRVLERACSPLFSYGVGHTALFPRLLAKPWLMVHKAL